MHILFVTTEYITETRFDGGLSNYLFRLCSYLTAYVDKVSVVTLSNVNEAVVFKGVNVYRVKSRTPLSTLLKSLKLSRLAAVIKIIESSYYLNRSVKHIQESEHIDIIQYSSYQSTGIFKPKYSPSIVRLSSYQPLIRWAQQRKASYADYLIELIERRTINSFEHIFSPSKYIVDHLEEAITSPIKVIESPYKMPNQHEFNDNYHSNWLRDKQYILYFGALTPIKGVDLIAKEIKTLLVNNPNCYIVFAGKDFAYKNQQMISFIWDSAGNEKSRVLYLGKLCRASLNSLIMHADVILLPSKTDNLPNACIEAMGLGKVVVGPMGASFDQLIEHEKSGLLFEHNNSKSLLVTTQSALDMSLEEKKVMGEYASKRVQELDPTYKIPELLEYYKQVISSHPKS